MGFSRSGIEREKEGRCCLSEIYMSARSFLTHAVEFYSSDQTGEIHSHPYSVTDVKAIGLGLWLAGAVRLPSEEGLYAHDK